MSTNRWTDKEEVVYIHNGILLSHKREWNNAICSNIDGSRDYHTKWSKSKRRTLSDITYMQNLKYGTNEPIYETDSQTENRLVVTTGEAVHRGCTGSLGLVDTNYYIQNG